MKPKLSDLGKQQLPIEIKIKNKARQFVGNLPGGWGRGGVDKMIVIINEALDAPCPYCGNLLSLINISLDHKEPIIRHKVRQKLYSKEELQSINSPANIHMICRKCNSVKREIPHQKFLKLIAFLDEDEVLKKSILDRLSSSNVIWANRFKRG